MTRSRFIWASFILSAPTLIATACLLTAKIAATIAGCTVNEGNLETCQYLGKFIEPVVGHLIGISSWLIQYTGFLAIFGSCGLCVALIARLIKAFWHDQSESSPVTKRAGGDLLKMSKRAFIVSIALLTTLAPAAFFFALMFLISSNTGCSAFSCVGFGQPVGAALEALYYMTILLAFPTSVALLGVPVLACSAVLCVAGWLMRSRTTGASVDNA